MKKLKEKMSNSDLQYDGIMLKVYRDKVKLPNGTSALREWVDHLGAVCCVPLLPDGKIAMIRQYRYAVNLEMIELPAGKLDHGESPEDCAIRELQEEIGYRPKKITCFAKIHPAVGFANEKMWLFIAEDLEKTEINLDKDEFLELVPMELKNAIDMVWSGIITDAKTIVGLVWAARLLSE